MGKNMEKIWDVEESEGKPVIVAGHDSCEGRVRKCREKLEIGERKCLLGLFREGKIRR